MPDVPICHVADIDRAGELRSLCSVERLLDMYVVSLKEAVTQWLLDHSGINHSAGRERAASTIETESRHDDPYHNVCRAVYYQVKPKFHR